MLESVLAFLSDWKKLREYPPGSESEALELIEYGTAFWHAGTVLKSREVKEHAGTLAAANRFDIRKIRQTMLWKLSWFFLLPFTQQSRNYNAVKELDYATPKKEKVAAPMQESYDENWAEV